MGRAAEQQAIRRLVAAARLGTSGALVIRGAPGVGKTALLDDAVASFEGVHVLRATGVESEREIPFSGLLQLIRPALPLIGGIPPAQAEALTGALSGGVAGAGPRTPDRFAIGAAVLGLLCRLAEEHPVAVVVDDLHLVDAPSAEALVFATRRLAVDPVVVLATGRAPDVDERIVGLPVLDVAGLDLAGSRALLDGRGSGLAGEDRLELLHRATDGNPLALLELAGADRDELDRLSSGLPLRVPDAVTAAFARRLESLDAACQSVLLVASVCGGDLRTTSDACSRLGLDPARLGDAEDAGLVAVDVDRVVFRHPLLRAAAYSRARVRDRRDAHRAVAEVLPASDVDRRAWHLSEATWHPDAEVAALLSEAAENAMARTAYSVASTAFDRAARSSVDYDARGRLLLRAAEAAWLGGQGARAVALLDRRTGEALDTHHRASALELRGMIAARSGSLRQALDLLVAAADETDDPDAAAVLLADAVHATFYLADARAAEALAERQAELASRLASPRARALGLMSTGIARVLSGTGGVEEIRAAVPLLESTSELTKDPRRLPWLLLAPLFLRDATSGRQLRTIVDEVRGTAGVGMMPSVLFHVARDQATSDAWRPAEANYLESVRLAAETGQETEQAMSLAGLAWLESRQGRSDLCREHAARARSLCAARDIHLGEVWASYAVADLDLSLGNAAEASDELRELVELLRRLGVQDPDLLPGAELTDALLRLGRREEAAKIARRFWDAAAAKGQPWSLARAHRALGMVAEEGFESSFHEALAGHAATLDRFESARTMLAFGERLRRAGRRVDAREQLRPALTEFEALGAVSWADRAATELEATGESVRRGDTVTVALTPQELQVCELLAEGKTTRETAAALFLSPKTVEYHLRKVYVKLSIRSRAELARAMEDLKT